MLRIRLYSILICLLVAGFSAGCGGSGGPSGDNSATVLDIGGSDAGDSGVGGGSDAAPTDTGRPDIQTTDTGVRDSGKQDTGTPPTDSGDSSSDTSGDTDAGADTGPQCKSGAECQSGVCESGKCKPPACDDSVRNGNETDTDCGGPDCGPCATGKSCAKAGDCDSNVCKSGTCAAPTCMDSAHNGKETDSDCGGPTCNGCKKGENCKKHSDCATGACDSGMCVAPSCMDSTKNGKETDSDCGGPDCQGCAPGKNCSKARDCGSNVCKNGTCQKATCKDSVTNGTESDTDCGGASCGACGAGKKCGKAGDCASGVCKNGTCQKPTCKDSVTNANETDTDCGGPTCNACKPGKSCAKAGDCTSGVCKSGTCAKPTCNDGVSNGSEFGVDCGGSCKACPRGPKLRIVFDRDWIETKVEGDSVQVNCFPVDKKGRKQSKPSDLKITMPAKATKTKKGRYAFKKAGTYDVKCSSQKLGMSAKRTLVVAFAGIDRDYVKSVHRISKFPGAIEAILDANAKRDKKAYTKAVDHLETLGKELPSLGKVDFLIKNPHGWPSPKAVKKAGFKPAKDDAKWLATLKSLGKAIKAQRPVINGLTNSPTKKDVQSLARTEAKIRAELATLNKLKPSDYAVWKHRSEVETTMDALVETQRKRALKLATVFRANPPSSSSNPSPGGFSLVGTMVTMAVRERLSSYTYKSVLTDVGKTAVASMISMAIKKVINQGFTPGANAPSLTTVHGNSAGFVRPQGSFKASGSFNKTLSKNKIIFIPPSVSHELTKIVDVVNTLNGITKERNILKLKKQLESVYSNLKAIFNQAVPKQGKQYLILTPTSAAISGQILNYPQLPKGINCNRFQLPVAGTMIPLDEDYGRGKAINVNVIGEPPSHCP